MKRVVSTGEGRNKIILVGYRACGKSSVGRKLAAELGWEFLDLDAEIVARAGISIREIVARHGWEQFRAEERRLLAELLPRTRLVVATGGGAVLHREIWPDLRQNSLVVWLTAAAATIAERILSDPISGEQRPALTDQELPAEIATVLAQREELYRRAAHLTLAGDRLTPEEIATRVLTHWQTTQADHL